MNTFSNLYCVGNKLFCFDCLSEDNKNEIVTEDDINIEVINAKQLEYDYAIENEKSCSICSCEPMESNNNTSDNTDLELDSKEEKLTAKERKAIKKQAEKIITTIDLTIEEFIITDEMREKFTEEQLQNLENEYYKKAKKSVENDKKEITEIIINNHKDLNLKVELKEIYVQRGPLTIAKVVPKARRSWKDIMDL